MELLIVVLLLGLEKCIVAHSHVRGGANYVHVHIDIASAVATNGYV